MINLPLVPAIPSTKGAGNGQWVCGSEIPEETIEKRLKARLATVEPLVAAIFWLLLKDGSDRTGRGNLSAPHRSPSIFAFFFWCNLGKGNPFLYVRVLTSE